MMKECLCRDVCVVLSLSVTDLISRSEPEVKRHGSSGFSRSLAICLPGQFVLVLILVLVLVRVVPDLRFSF